MDIASNAPPDVRVAAISPRKGFIAEVAFVLAFTASPRISGGARRRTAEEDVAHDGLIRRDDDERRLGHSRNGEGGGGGGVDVVDFVDVVVRLDHDAGRVWSCI